ncbi:hypothetical protein LMG28688_07252 [Paraburkholderia caffeinitolerans]|uniref:Uncharacterized protein n=1 Tax=Paraburkholderia caffeinitolerans TaxID=1723730 RepID=A0A6J5H7R0_9BURK|nr:hypothetical protein LMG28688_07252 [Paraburkholderia caffeinitolerans]
MLLHRAADLVRDGLRVLARGRVVELRKAREREVGGVCRQRLVLLQFLHVLDDVVAGSAAEHHEVEQRVRAQAVCAVHRDARAFAHGVEAVDDFFVALRRADDLTIDVGRDAAHLVVNRRHDRDRFLDAVHVRELQRDFADRRQTLHDRLCADVREVEQHVILVRANTAAFLDFLVHRTRDEVTRCEVLQRGRIALHEALAVGVAQNAAFAAHAFGNQHARAGHAGRVELPELHVLQRDARTGRHAQAITGVDERVGGCREDPARAARGEQRGLAFEDIDVARFHFERGHAEHVAFGVADQVQRHPFDEERGLRRDVLLVQRVQQRVAGTVSSRTGALDRLLAVVGRVAAERALVNGAVRIAVERHAHVFQFVDGVRRFTAHELDRVLVAEPVGALDRVVEVEVPVVFAHVAERSADAALGSNGVRTRREHLREHADREARARQLQRGAHPRTARADDDHVEFATRQRILDCSHSFTLSRESERRSRGCPAAMRS